MSTLLLPASADRGPEPGQVAFPVVLADIQFKAGHPAGTGQTLYPPGQLCVHAGTAAGRQVLCLLGVSACWHVWPLTVPCGRFL
jgi:hypothetical protein